MVELEVWAVSIGSPIHFFKSDSVNPDLKDSGVNLKNDQWPCCSMPNACQIHVAMHEVVWDIDWICLAANALSVSSPKESIASQHKGDIRCDGL